MHHYTQGKPTSQAHKGIPEGMYEEEQGQGGFFGPVSHLIKEKPSTRWTEIDGPLKPRMFDVIKLAGGNLEAFSGQRMLFNSDVTISYLKIKATGSATNLKARRNADGDWLYFCHKGAGHVMTEYGLL